VNLVPCPLGQACPEPGKRHRPGSQVLALHMAMASGSGRRAAAGAGKLAASPTPAPKTAAPKRIGSRFVTPAAFDGTKDFIEAAGMTFERGEPFGELTIRRGDTDRAIILSRSDIDSLRVPASGYATSADESVIQTLDHIRNYSTNDIATEASIFGLEPEDAEAYGEVAHDYARTAMNTTALFDSGANADPDAVAEAVSTHLPDTGKATDEDYARVGRDVADALGFSEAKEPLSVHRRDGNQTVTAYFESGVDSEGVQHKFDLGNDVSRGASDASYVVLGKAAADLNSFGPWTTRALKQGIAQRHGYDPSDEGYAHAADSVYRYCAKSEGMRSKARLFLGEPDF
jgi:hypothetical protein